MLPVYIIDMELGKQSLTEFIRLHFHSGRPNPLRPADVWGIMAQLARGIAFMHHRGVIHRDLKPDNSNPSLYLG